MKFDIKSWLIMILLVVVIVFGGMWYFKKDEGSAQRVKDLEKEIVNIQKQKHDIDLVLLALKNNQAAIEKEISDKTAQLAIMEKENARLSAQVTISKQNLDALRKKLKETQDKIDELTKNPVKREGDDLLNSLKNNTK